MFPPPAHQVFGSPNAKGPDGLEAGVAALFGGPDPNAVAEDPYENLDRVKLLKRFTDFKDDAMQLRPIFERAWWRILLYLVDRQWIFLDLKRNEWRDKRLKKWIPKPVTNKMKEVQNSIRAMFSAVQLGTIVRPNGNDPKNIATANTADQLQPLIDDEHKMPSVMALADFWLVNLGNAFLYAWWNPDEGEVQPINHDECLTCGLVTDPATLPNPAMFQCPQCGGVDAQPKEVGAAPLGKGCTDVVSPFEILAPSAASTFDEANKVARIRWRTRDYYEDNYPELAKTLTWEKQPSQRSLHLFKSLTALSDGATKPFTWGTGQAQSEGLTEYEYWEKPSKAYPKGLFFRVVGETNPQIVEDENQSTPGPIPTETIKGNPLWPWIHISYELFGGRMWSAGAIDPLLQKQDQINQLDSLMQLIVQRMANPVWLEPKGAEVEKFTGEPGLVVKYQTIGPSGQGKPERLDGTGPHASLFTLREQYLRDIEEMAGTYDILKGSKPTGVEAFSALQLLVERSQSRFTEAFRARGEAYQAWFKIALELERKYGPTQRTIASQGPNNTWTFQTFQQANLQGDVSIIAEDGTNVPKTSLGRRAAMEQARNMGFVDPADPDQKNAFFTEMGLTNLMPGLDAARKSALRMQDAFEKWVQETGAVGVAPLRVQPWDDPMILMNELRKWANSDRMQEMLADPAIGENVALPLVLYFQQLASMVAAAQAAANPQPGGDGKPGDKGPGHTPGAGQAMARSNANSTPQHQPSSAPAA